VFDCINKRYFAETILAAAKSARGNGAYLCNQAPVGSATALDEFAREENRFGQIVAALFITARRLPTRLSLACALFLTGTVLMLAILAASPDAHHWLHAEADHADHECAVTLFAQGVTTAAVAVALAVVISRLLGLSRSARVELFLSAPRFLHLPGRAPPRG
jgi:hypothetical protein